MAGNEASNTGGNTGGNNQQKSVEQTKKELLAQLTKELGLDAAQGNYKQEYVQQIGYNPAQIKEAMSGVMQATAQAREAWSGHSKLMSISSSKPSP